MMAEGQILLNEHKTQKFNDYIAKDNSSKLALF